MKLLHIFSERNSKPKPHIGLEIYLSTSLQQNIAQIKSARFMGKQLKSHVSTLVVLGWKDPFVFET
jgi:hypothetical protein